MQIQQLAVALTQLTTQCATLADLMQPGTSALPLVAQPHKFMGEPSQCQGFLLQCHSYFTALEEVSDKAKIMHFFSMLTSTPLSRTTVVCKNGGEPLSSYNCFITLFH